MENKTLKRWLTPFGCGLVTLLSGCSHLDVLNPKGSIGVAEKSLIWTATYTMLVVIVPVILLTLLFAWRYRASNLKATYAPKWAHSTAIEVVVWTIPSLIILFLAILTWKSTHELDPYQPLKSNVKPVEIEVVALDWKWLFIYPEYGIATVNQIEFPVGTPVDFHVTSDSVMNSFFIPQLGSQIYAMAGMQTRVHLIADEAGDFAGVSANYSGAGYSDMKFRAIATTPEQFKAWVQKVKASPEQLDMDTYYGVAKPSEKAPVRYFASSDPELFHKIMAKYNNGHYLDTTGSVCQVKG
jgi:cytochrome o ubiquinol oxidase subunit 2